MPLVSSMLGDLTEGFTLPITRKGLFSEDDFFKGYQKDYSNAVEDVLGRWGSRASQADRFASYKRMRERDASDDSLAATISDTGDNYVIVLDMSEFANGMITVDTVQCSAVVEGKYGSRSYNKKFPLPQNTIIDRVTADLSDENILTITAPRKGDKVIAINTDLTDKSTQPATSSGDTTASYSQMPASLIACIEKQIIPTQSQIDLDAPMTTTTGRTIPLTVEGETAVSATTQEVKSETSSSTDGKSSHSRTIPVNVEGGTSSHTQSSTTSSSEIEAGKSVEGGTSSYTQSSTTSSSEIEAGKSVSERVIPITAGKEQAIHTISSSLNRRVLPITKRGRFFQDATFENVWKDFETAIDELVVRKGSRAGMEQDQDRFQSYRNLRTVLQQDDNQAATISKESNECKIVVDVKDFVDGDLDVKAVQGAIVVSGKKGPCSFERRFSVTGITQLDKVTSALSTDGVLTITAPL